MEIREWRLEIVDLGQAQELECKAFFVNLQSLRLISKHQSPISLPNLSVALDGGAMAILKGFLQNLLVLAAIVIGMFILAPSMMEQITRLLGDWFGVVLLAILVLATAVPQLRRRQH